MSNARPGDGTGLGRVLVGSDGSETAGAAVRWAAEVAMATGAELAVAFAWQPPFAEVPPATYDELQAEALATLTTRACGPARAAGSEPRGVLLEGDPREALLETADTQAADLVVVGARGAGGERQALGLGSVPQYLSHHTSRPLACIPRDAGSPRSARVLVAVDGSDGSAAAVAWCAAVGPALGVKAVAVHVLDADVPHRPEADALAQWAAPLEGGGLLDDTKLVEGGVVDALTRTAQTERVDLAVLGTRGLGGFTHLRLGSTAFEVLYRGGFPVVLVPPPSGA